MKGVIIAAGYGTRFLPMTKTVAKEMLPLYDKPMIDFILDEFEDAGISDVIFVTSRRKKHMEDYTDREVELETALEKARKTEMLESIRPRKMNFTFIRQTEMKGTGNAILMVKPFVGDEPFIVAYPDDLVLSRPGLSKSMADHFAQHGKSILAVREEPGDVSRYGVCSVSEKNGALMMDGIVEKPAKGTEPSHFVSIGRYLFTPELLSLLEEGWAKHTGGEFYHIDAINALAKKGEVTALPINGVMLDTGEPQSYFRSLLAYAATTDSGREILKRFYKDFQKD